MQHHYEHEELQEVLEDVGTEDPKDLIVYNDDINTFEHVINTLIKVCKHTAEQAEQCTWIIHHKGKCAVKKGNENYLIPMKDAILDAGISAAVL